ncbi:MAG: hypothetical protein ACM4D3_01565 [Candidatus Sericytochromatia bacterium]
MSAYIRAATPRAEALWLRISVRSRLTPLISVAIISLTRRGGGVGGVLQSAVVSGGLRHGEISGLTTVDVMPPGHEPEVAFAGVWAQACWRHGRRPSQREMYGMLDGTGCKDRNMLSAAGGTAAGVGIVPLLERCWPTICEVATQLFGHSQVSHDDVTKALGLSVDPNTAAIELAHIRVGSAPGSFTVTKALSAREMAHL